MKKYKITVTTEFCGTDMEEIISAGNKIDLMVMADTMAYNHMLEMFDDVFADDVTDSELEEHGYSREDHGSFIYDSDYTINIEPYTED